MLIIIVGARQGTIHGIPLTALLPTLPLLPTSPSLLRLFARPGFLLRRSHQISAAVFEDECREVGLTPAQLGVLTVLSAQPGLGQSSLARALGFDKVTVLRVLRGLENRGLVARTPAPDNKRNISASLTQAGERLLVEAQKPAEAAYERLLAPLDPQQQGQLLLLLQVLTGKLENDARAAFIPPGQT